MKRCLSIRGDILPRRYSELEKQILSECVSCGICISACPVLPMSDLSKVKAKDISEEVSGALRGACVSENVIERAFACSRCGICIDICPKDLNVYDFQQALRGRIMSAGGRDLKFPNLLINGRIWDTNTIDEALVSIQIKPWDRPWVDEIPQNPKAVDTVLFLGCHNRRHVSTISTVVDILKSLQLEFVTVGGGNLCCGTPAQIVGRLSDGDKQGSRLISALSRYKPREVIVICPACHYRMQKEISQFCNVPFAIRHVHTTIAERLHKASFVQELDRKVTFHDPCKLGRMSGDYESARTVLRGIPDVSLVEMADNRKESRCCGGTAWLYNPDYAERLRESAMRCAAETGADVLATACLFCHENFSKVSAEYPYEILDVLELLGEGMGVRHENKLKKYATYNNPEQVINEAGAYIDVSSHERADLLQFLRVFFG